MRISTLLKRQGPSAFSISIGRILLRISRVLLRISRVLLRISTHTLITLLRHCPGPSRRPALPCGQHSVHSSAAMNAQHLLHHTAVYGVCACAWCVCVCVRVSVCVRESTYTWTSERCFIKMNNVNVLHQIVHDQITTRSSTNNIVRRKQQRRTWTR
jgi:hypothetical protein